MRLRASEDYERVVMALIMTSTLIEDAAGEQECQVVVMFDGLFWTDKEAESVVCSWILHNQCLTSKQIAENGLEKSQQRHRFPVLSAERTPEISVLLSLRLASPQVHSHKTLNYRYQKTFE